MRLTFGFSPCPNDTFIFDALVNGLIDTGDLSFDVSLEDIQTLNESAIHHQFDICKVSYATLPLVLDHYVALASGGALGKGVGPLLISSKPIPDAAVRLSTIAIPGQHTTANVLFSLVYPEATNKAFLRYDEIENYVLTNAADNTDPSAMKLGVIIHENRFTYEQKGLVKLADLGERWEHETGFPIPLGCIVVRRSIATNVIKKIEQLIASSMEYSQQRYPELSNFIRNNAQEMEESVMRQHIDLYVNEFSRHVGTDGRNAVMKFLQVHSSINKLPVDLSNVYLPE